MAVVYVLVRRQSTCTAGVYMYGSSRPRCWSTCTAVLYLYDKGPPVRRWSTCAALVYLYCDRLRVQM
jgi:hypothetical protein